MDFQKWYHGCIHLPHWPYHLPSPQLEPPFPAWLKRKWQSQVWKPLSLPLYLNVQRPVGYQHSVYYWWFHISFRTGRSGIHKGMEQFFKYRGGTLSAPTLRPYKSLIRHCRFQITQSLLIVFVLWVYTKKAKRSLISLRSVERNANFKPKGYFSVFHLRRSSVFWSRKLPQRS